MDENQPQKPGQTLEELDAVVNQALGIMSTNFTTGDAAIVAVNVLRTMILRLAARVVELEKEAKRRK